MDEKDAPEVGIVRVSEVVSKEKLNPEVNLNWLTPAKRLLELK